MTVIDRSHLTALEPPPDDDPYTHHNGDEPTGHYDHQAERAALGACLTNHPTALADVTTRLTAADFHRPAHETIYTAIEHHYARGLPVDPITITDHLHATKQLARAGGTAHLHELTLAVTTPTSAGYYADIIAEHATRRRAITALTHALQALQTPTGDTPDQIKTNTINLLERIHTRPPGTDQDQPPGPWQPIPLDGILDGTAPPDPGATLLARQDGKHLLYTGAVHSIAGEPGVGKTWWGLIGAVQQLNQGATVAMIDFEDRPSRVTRRLLALDAQPDQIRSSFRYIHPDVALTPTSRRDLDKAIDGASLVIIDGITEAMTLQGMSYLDNEDIARWLALIPHHIARQGPAVLQVDHLPKSKDNQQRFAIGGQHKLAAIDGAAFLAHPIKGFSRGTKGSTKIVVAKDKHGDVGPNGMTIAVMHVDATDTTGRVFAWLEPPTASTDDDGQFRPTVLMHKVSEYLTNHPGATGNDIRRDVRGKREGLNAAVDALIRDGFITTTQGPRNSILHHLVAEFEE